jgi:hypothetical protein
MPTFQELSPLRAHLGWQIQARLGTDLENCQNAILARVRQVHFPDGARYRIWLIRLG